MHATERARRVATVAELEVVRCISSRSDQTGKYFSYNFGVVCPFFLPSLFFSSLLFSSVISPYLPLPLSSLLFSSLLVSCRTGWKQRRATAASICRVVCETHVWVEVVGRKLDVAEVVVAPSVGTVSPCLEE